jgi:hypothetical protein
VNKCLTNKKQIIWFFNGDIDKDLDISVIIMKMKLMNLMEIDAEFTAIELS